ncbi:MAG: Ku protein [Acidobacteriaceae bacterium]|nr:Ku protein [Acidobacteriaceae bacterium]
MASTVWRGYISFGLISIPVRLFRAARAERVGLRRLYRSEPSPSYADTRQPSIQLSEQRLRPVEVASRGKMQEPATPEPARAEPVLAPVRQVSVEKGTDAVLPEASVVKGYEYEKGRYVAIEAEELKSLVSKTSSGMEIQEFVSLAEIDPVYFETSYYVTPEEAGEKAYALLYRSMQTTGLVAIAQFAMHTREHIVVLRPGKTGLLAHTMFFASEVRADEEYRADVSAVAEKELELAQTLIRSLAASFEPGKYRDTYRERLESIIARKVQGQPVTPLEAPPRPAAVVDIAEALRKSLANLKKPATSVQTAKSEPPAAARPKKRSRSAAQK